MGPLFASETVAWVAPTRKDLVVRTQFCSPLSSLRIQPEITPHLSLRGPYVLDTGFGKDKEKRDDMDRVSVPLTCCHFPKFCLWVPEAGSLRLRFSIQFNEHLWEESHDLSDCRHPGTVQQFSVRSRACLAM